MTHIFTLLCSSNLQEFNTILNNFGIKIKQFLNVFFLKILSIKTINVQNFVIHRKGFSSYDLNPFFTSLSSLNSQEFITFLKTF